MDSDDDQQEFAPKNGEALNLEQNDDAFNDSGQDSEDVDEPEDDDVPQKKGSSAKPGMPPKEVKGEKLENQPYDLAVDVNDSEEIESDEEDDEVNMNDVGRSTQNQV